MKTLFTLLSGALLSTAAFANDVTVTLSNANKYQVIIDGRSLYNNGYSNNNNTFYLRNLPTGQHNIQVVRTYGNSNNGRWNNGRNNDVVYSSSFRIDPQYDLFIQVDNRGRVDMNQRRSSYDNGYGNGRDRRDRDNDRDDHRNDRNGNWNDNRNNGSYGNGSYNNGYGNRSAMSDAQFNQVIQHIRSQWFGKFNTAKQTVSDVNNLFSTYQVRQVLQLFSSESDKLELAKLAYRQTVDAQNYRQLYDLFSTGGQADLDNYVRSFRY